MIHSNNRIKKRKYLPKSIFKIDIKESDANRLTYLHPTGSRKPYRVDDALFIHLHSAVVDGFDHPPYEAPPLGTPATRRVDDALFIHQNPAVADDCGHPSYEDPLAGYARNS